jgi:hypothetical protein
MPDGIDGLVITGTVSGLAPCGRHLLRPCRERRSIPIAMIANSRSFSTRK